MSQEFDIFEVYDNLERNNIMLTFKGELNSGLLTSILHTMEQKLEILETNFRLRKKVFNIMVECLQNLYHHSDKMSDQNTQSISDASGMVMISKNETGYSIMTGNFMINASANELEKKLEQVNAMTRDELKSAYRKVLSNGQFSQKGGAGLGIIDLARKSGEALEFGFVPYNQTSQFFSLNVKVNQ